MSLRVVKRFEAVHVYEGKDEGLVGATGLHDLSLKFRDAGSALVRSRETVQHEVRSIDG